MVLDILILRSAKLVIFFIKLNDGGSGIHGTAVVSTEPCKGGRGVHTTVRLLVLVT